MKRFAAQLLILCFGALAVWAQEARPVADDPILEQRVMALSHELRCMVCQNETLADSRADLANDLRNQIREQMKAGKSDQEIIAFLTERYGEKIRYRPPIKPTTYALWFGPPVLLVAGLVFLYRHLKARRELIKDEPLSAEERRRVDELLRVGSDIAPDVTADGKTA